MSNQETWHETLHNHFGQYFTVDNVLWRETTGQQDLVIFETPHWAGSWRWTAWYRPPSAMSLSIMR